MGHATLRKHWRMFCHCFPLQLFSAFRVNFVFVFDFNARNRLSHFELFRAATSLTLAVCFDAMFAFVIAGSMCFSCVVLSDLFCFDCVQIGP